MRHGIQKTRRQTAKSTVTKAGIDLLFNEGVKRRSHFAYAIGNKISKPIIQKVVIQKRSEQKLKREVIHLFGFFGMALRFNGTRLSGNEPRQHRIPLFIGTFIKFPTQYRHTQGAILLLKILRILKNLISCHATPKNNYQTNTLCIFSCITPWLKMRALLSLFRLTARSAGYFSVS